MLVWWPCSASPSSTVVTVVAWLLLWQLRPRPPILSACKTSITKIYGSYYENEQLQAKFPEGDLIDGKQKEFSSDNFIVQPTNYSEQRTLFS